MLHFERDIKLQLYNAVTQELAGEFEYRIPGEDIANLEPDREKRAFVVRFLNEENFIVEGYSDWTVNMLKQEIMKQQGVPSDDQYIYHNELISDDTVIGGIKWKELKHAAMNEDQ